MTNSGPYSSSVIRQIYLEKLTPSASGKTLVVANTRGIIVSVAEVDCKPITIVLNAYIKP